MLLATVGGAGKKGSHCMDDAHSDSPRLLTKDIGASRSEAMACQHNSSSVTLLAANKTNDDLLAWVSAQDGTSSGSGTDCDDDND